MSYCVRYTLTAPITDNDGRTLPILPIGRDHERYQDFARRIVADRFGGYTEQVARGYWTSSDGCETFSEEVIVFTIDAFPDDWTDVMKLAARIKEYADQDAVYVTRQTIERELI